MVKRKWLAIGALLVIICFTVIATTTMYIYISQDREGDGKATSKEKEKIGVIVTILPQAEFVKKVGKEKVKVTVMVPPEASPHTYEPTPSQLKKVNKAKVYFKVGSGVEFEQAWMGKIIGVNKDMMIVDTSKGIELIDEDPHIWLSPLNAKKMVANICEGLIQVDPDNADFYTQNKRDYMKELDILDEYVHDKLEGFTNRAFMIYHPALIYFANEYNLTQLSVECGGKEPTPKVILECVEKAKKYKLHYIFMEPQFATENCEVIADEIEGEIALMDPFAKNYTSNIKHIADSLSLEFVS